MKNFYLLLLLVFFIISSPLFSQNNALNFDGSNYARINSTLVLGITNVTLECWVNIPTISEKGTFIQVGNSNAPAAGYSIGVGSGDFDHHGNELILLFDIVRWVPTEVNIGTGWHHIAFSLDQNSYPSIYLDGVLVYTDSGIAPGTPSGVTTIGSNSPSQDRTLTNGTIDEVRFWNDVRTPTELRANMYKELVGNETNLVSYTKLNESSGTTSYDSKTGGSNNFTLYNSPSKIPSSAFFGPKNALGFDGNNDYVSISDLFLSGNTITMEGWFYTSTFNGLGDQYITNLMVGGDENILIRLGDFNMDNNMPQFVVDVGGTHYKLNANVRINANKWYHLAAVYDGSEMKLYVNGELDNSMSFTGIISTTTTPFILGGNLPTERMFDGRMDEVRIWNTARTAAQIRENMNKTLIGDEANLVSYYNFDNSRGTMLQDFSASGFDGTCIGYGFSASGTITSQGPGSNEDYWFEDNSASWTVNALTGMTVSITTTGNVVTDYIVGSNTNNRMTKDDWEWPFYPYISYGDAYTITENNPDADWVSSSAFNTWLNTGNSAWGTASNWSDGVPGATDNVGIYTYSGASNVNISGIPSVNNLVIGSSTVLTVASDATVNGNFVLLSNLDLNGNIITIANTGILIEDGGILSGSTGYSTFTNSVNNISAEDIGGLGVEITSSSNLGSTVVERYHSAITGPTADEGINRYYKITPTTNTGLNATLVFHYDDSELNGLIEGDLKLYKSINNGSTWTEVGGTVNTTNNTITLSSIDGFSWWTAAETGSTLPVELLSFTANCKSDKIVELNWTTASETNNSHFEIQKSSDAIEFTKVGEIDGEGNSNITNYYEFNMDRIDNVNNYFRLKQIDFDGKFEYSDIITLDCNNKQRNIEIYPNPFINEISIDFNMPTQNNVVIELRNILGVIISKEELEINSTNHTFILDDLSAGIYFVVVSNGEETIVRKLVKE